MEFPEKRYYRLTHILLSMIGLWPYDNFKNRHIRFIISLLIIVSFASIQWIKLCTSEFSSDLVIEILSYNVPYMICFIKYISFYAVSKNIKEFRERIRNNWDALKDNREIEIICKQGSNGKLLTICIIMTVYTLGLVFILSQYVSIFLDIVIPLNTSRPRKFLIVAEFFIDDEKYFYTITIYIAISLIIPLTCIIATESFTITNSLHAFGLFKVASYRMKHVLSGINPHLRVTKKYTISHNRIIAAVDFHRRAIEFSDLLKTNFGQVYLILLFLGLCSASVNLFNLSRIIMTEKEILEILKSVFLVGLHILYFGLGNYAGQEFINCDTHVYRTICDTKWYNAPLKIQKLILFLIQKTTKCYKVDAGGMFSPSLEGLATGLSMSISYFMVLRTTL